MKLVSQCCKDHFELRVNFSPYRWNMQEQLQNCLGKKGVWVCGPPAMNDDFRKTFAQSEDPNIKRSLVIF